MASVWVYVHSVHGCGHIVPIALSGGMTEPVCLKAEHDGQCDIYILRLQILIPSPKPGL